MSSSADVIGRHVLVGITCVDGDDEVVAQFQTHGVVEDVRAETIVLRRDDGSSFGLPPVLDLLEPAKPAIYRLRSGEEVDSPDFTATLKVTVRDPAETEELEEHGYLPPVEYEPHG